MTDKIATLPRFHYYYDYYYDRYTALRPNSSTIIDGNWEVNKERKIVHFNGKC